MPRLVTKSTTDSRAGLWEPKDVRTLINIVKEHDREPGVFDYNHDQYFYSTFPEID